MKCIGNLAGHALQFPHRSQVDFLCREDYRSVTGMHSGELNML